MFISKALDFFCLIVEVKIPKLVLLSVIAVGGWMGTAVLALWNMPIISTSVTEDITLWIVFTLCVWDHLVVDQVYWFSW